jgi:hypothetical protein
MEEINTSVKGVVRRISPLFLGDCTQYVILLEENNKLFVWLYDVSRVFSGKIPITEKGDHVSISFPKSSESRDVIAITDFYNDSLS